ncbi:MAG: pyridoxal phosphate-dependent aminotransferase [Vulcanimicrobiaceae bacterium]
MTMHTSPAIDALPRSGIREIMELADQIPDAIVLGAGEPNFATPEHIRRAAAAAAEAGHTKYTPNLGIPALRAVLVDKLRDRNGYAVTADRIIVTNGGVEALFTSMTAILEPGDEILLPDPGWPNTTAMAHILRATPIYFPLAAEHGFVPRIEDLEPLVTAKTRALLINSPSNPLGSVIDRSRMRELVAFAEARNLWLISDECYDEIVFDDRFVSAAAVGNPERIFSVYTFSKTYAMTGWRVGYVAVPSIAAPLVAKLQEPITSCINAPAQHAAIAAITGPQECVREMRDAYRDRRDGVATRFARGGIGVHPAAGAFYAWADISASGRSSRDFALALLRERQVAVAPGTAFGVRGEGYVRLSLATASDRLYEGVDRIVEFVQAHRPALA